MGRENFKMFVMTAKVSKTRIAAVFVLLIALVVLLVMLFVGKGQAESAVPAGDSSDARLSFLTGYGWEVNADPVRTQQVTIPQNEENQTFQRYNELQKSMGYDLTAYAGKTATRYVYELLNYPDAAGPAYATLFVCEGQIIGGDVTDTGPGGKMSGFQMPQ